MEVTFYEDPACSWCWAFEPVSTVFAYEFQGLIKARHVMGGLRDRPASDVSFVSQQWKKAEAVSGMPFECEVWKKRPLSSTFPACRAVKAASLIDEPAGLRLLRRLREAFYVERVLIDEPEAILSLANEIGINIEALGESLANGRAETLFARDRDEASKQGFGFPTIVIRSGHQDEPAVLQGAVPYAEILQALASAGFNPRVRLRFRDSQDGWQRLFRLHRRLTFPEILAVTQMEKSALLARLEEIGVRRSGCFFEAPEILRVVPVLPSPAARPRAGGEASPASSGSPLKGPASPEDHPWACASDGAADPRAPAAGGVPPAPPESAERPLGDAPDTAAPSEGPGGED